jgi:hypothetical protein
MSKPAFIVDGHTEQCFISQVCPGRPIQRTNLNGKNVTVTAIAKKIASMIRLFGNRHYPIIVLIDKEDREADGDTLCNELHNHLKNEGIINQDIRIGIADRMIENWIIADYQLIGNVQDKPEKTDGLRGSVVIKRALGSYNKVIEGVKLLSQINKTIVYQNSPSFKIFVDKLDNIECDYVNFQK